MKIIHCSDLHLDSKMEANLSKEKAKERKAEILLTFCKLIEYAKENDVKIIIIAGDMFDKKTISVKAKNIVKDAISSNKDIDFIYLKGNHDECAFLEEDEIPENLKMFSNKEWTTYRYENLAITGIELGEKEDYEIYNTLILDKNDTNIVVMHGQESIYEVKDNLEIINLKALKNKNIDYLALGHIHKYKQERLDGRGVYCYSGCLEGRGFDECGEKGFVLLNIEDNKIESRFIPIAKRKIYEIKIDITGCNTTTEVENKIQEKLETIEKTSLIKIILIGKLEIDAERDIDYLVKKYNEIYYFVKIYDEATLKIDYMDYEKDASLKGEFIRLVLTQKLTEEEKRKIIETGIKALSKEEVI